MRIRVIPSKPAGLESIFKFQNNFLKIYIVKRSSVRLKLEVRRNLYIGSLSKNISKKNY